MSDDNNDVLEKFSAIAAVEPSRERTSRVWAIFDEYCRARPPVEEPSDTVVSAFYEALLPELYGPDGCLKPIGAATPEEREHIHAEQKQAFADSDVNRRAAAYMTTVLESLPVEVRIRASAPTRRRTKSDKRSQFSWAYPAIIPDRHACVLAWNGEGNYFAHAAAFGASQGNAQDQKLEVGIVKLLNGDTPPWDVVDARSLRPADSNIIVGAMLQVAWRFSDRMIALADAQHLTRDQTIIYPTGMPSLAATVLQRLVDLKTTGGRVSARAALLAIDAIARAFRKEVLKQ